jgi:hypothetical protein
MLDEPHPEPSPNSPEALRQLRSICLLLTAFAVCALLSGLGYEITLTGEGAFLGFAVALLIEGSFWYSVGGLVGKLIRR